jgi:hypothetical protein
VTSDPSNLVGPVLDTSEVGRALVNVVSKLNPGTRVEHRGGYLRVLVPERCFVTRQAVEHELGRPFRLPVDLELVIGGQVLANHQRPPKMAEATSCAVMTSAFGASGA